MVGARKAPIWLDGPYRRFLAASLTFVLVWMLYPVTLWMSLPTVADFQYYFKIELSWSFASALFLPIGAGLFAASIDRQLISRMRPFSLVCFLLLPSGVGLALIWFGVQQDVDGIPNPDRVSLASSSSFQSTVIQYDQCLRAKPFQDCLPGDSSAKLQCADQATPDLNRRIFPSSTATEEPFRKKLAYYCALRSLLNQHGLKAGDSVHAVAARTTVASAAIFLNFIFVGAIWLMICWMFFVAWTAFHSVKIEVIYIFASWVAILSIWFPARLYSEWQWWYRDLVHVYRSYDALLTLGVVAFLLMLFIAVWVFVRTGSDLMATLKGVYGLAGILLGAVGLAFRKEASDVFAGLEALSGTSLLLIGIVVLMILAIYIRGVLRQLAPG